MSYSDYFRVLYHYGDYFYAGANPLTQAAGLGSSLGLDIGSSVGFSCVIGEQLYYANGEGLPSVYSGESIYCQGFITYNETYGEIRWTDYTKEVIDQKDSTYGRNFLTTAAAGDACIYVRGNERLTGGS